MLLMHTTAQASSPLTNRLDAQETLSLEVGRQRGVELLPERLTVSDPSTLRG
jgi:hypothetical protein